MLIRKVLTVLVVLSIAIITISPNLSASKIYYKTVNDQETPETHIIEEDVPYVGQSTEFYCYLSSITMLIKYNGYNSSLNEILYNTGIGSALVYNRLFAPTRLPYGAMGLAGFDSYFSYLPEIYNLTYVSTHYNSSESSAEECWNKYWTRVKENVSKDIPVITSVNPYVLPHLWKYIDNKKKIGGHAVVIVGYNESNNTVCLNDPGPGFWGEPENGTYVNVSQDHFKQAVRKTKGQTHMVKLIYKPDGFKPVSEQERFDKAHRKNIERMKGNAQSYNNNIKYSLKSSRLGINGLKSFRRDLRIGLSHRFFTVWVIDKYTDTQLLEGYYILSVEKNNASQYLLNKTYLSEKCLHNGLLLKNESQLWYNMTMLVLKLKNISKNNNFLKTLIKSILLTVKMRKTLNEIISIEKQIIKCP